MPRKISKNHQPGMIDTMTFSPSSVKTFFKPFSKRQQTPIPQAFVKTVPKTQPDSDEEDATLLSDTASKDFGKPRKTRNHAQDAPPCPSAVGEAGQYQAGLRDSGQGSGLDPVSRNDIKMTENLPTAGVLKRHDPTAASQHPTINSHTTSASNMYEHRFLSEDQMFKTTEVDGDSMILPLPEGLGDSFDNAFEMSCDTTIRAVVSEMSAVSEVPSPVEAPTSPVMQNRRQSRVEAAASPRRPAPTSTASRSNDAVAVAVVAAPPPPRAVPIHTGLPVPPRFNSYNGNAPRNINAASTMAGQGASVAMARTTPYSVGPTSGPGARNTPTTNSGPLDRRDYRNSRLVAEVNEAPVQKQPRPPLQAIPQPSSRRESPDARATKPRNTRPMASGFEGAHVDDQERVNIFLQNHDIPQDGRLDPLSTLLQWVSVKLEQVDHKDGEFDQQASRLELRQRKIDELEAECLSLQSEWEKWANMQHEHLENANKTIALRGGDVQSERQRVQTLTDSLAEAEFQRDHANDNYQTLLQETEVRKEEDRALYEAEIERFTKAHAAQIMTLEEQMKGAQARLESRVATMERNHQQEIEITEAEIRRATAAISRAHEEEMEKLKDELSGTIARHGEEVERMEGELREIIAGHEKAMADLQDKHSHDLETERRAFQDLRRQMASYSSTGDYTAISDKEFEKSFQLHARSISNLIKWIPRPETYVLDENLDPNSFLARNAPQGGRNWPKFVRSVCWQFIVRGFFSRQLGFGAFGPDGEGFQELDCVHQLFAIADPTDPNGPNTILPNTKELNTWRAKFFDGLVQTIRNGPARQGEENKYARLFWTNVDIITDHLVAALQQVVSKDLDSTIREQVIGFVEGLGMLALEMGSQRAHICLETCEYGENIVVGDRFRDDAEQGYDQLTVDLMTQPCLRRIGDGRENLTTERTIAHGDFVAMKQAGLY